MEAEKRREVDEEGYEGKNESRYEEGGGKRQDVDEGPRIEIEGGKGQPGE